MNFKSEYFSLQLPARLEFAAILFGCTAGQPDTQTDTGLQFVPCQIFDVEPSESSFEYQFRNLNLTNIYHDNYDGKSNVTVRINERFPT